MIWRLAAFLDFAATLALIGEPVTLTVQPGGAFDVAYELSNGLATSATLEITGDLTAELSLADGLPSALRFTDGNIAYSDTTSELILSTFPVRSSISLQTRDVVSRIMSLPEAGALDAPSGVISNAGHEHHQDRGTISTRYFVAGLLVREEVRDLSEQADRGPLVGETVITLEEIGGPRTGPDLRDRPEGPGEGAHSGKRTRVCSLGVSEMSRKRSRAVRRESWITLHFFSGLLRTLKCTCATFPM